MQYDAICGYLIILLCTYIHGDTNLIDMRRVVLPTSCNRIYKIYLQTKSRFDPFEYLKALMVNRHTQIVAGAKQSPFVKPVGAVLLPETAISFFRGE